MGTALVGFGQPQVLGTLSSSPFTWDQLLGGAVLLGHQHHGYEHDGDLAAAARIRSGLGRVRHRGHGQLTAGAPRR